MVVLDSSALLALLLDEPGATAVEPVVRGAEVSIVNLCEVLTKAAEAGGNIEGTKAILLSYGITVMAFHEAQAMEAARLRPLTMHLGLSLGDRACLAQGHISALPILTADQQMAKADIGVDIRLIR
ncbi:MULTISPECIES: type II toxin-antitoxin system VapC family toxin [unclassified Sphingomonas]|uniref:type II toxin-antitoxin system VapC family toxin n=1 Tax=unclassified Sphingomonas TaxID=196159 RepID=UPI000BCDC58C|nr:MAG: hypothetical protein B7Z43_10730 [Sphingomonas sp. 12-62-6]OYX38223.1 MAG: hypothetical protein B7Y98_09355 [Sphingomonas sp. 32-62-10]